MNVQPYIPHSVRVTKAWKDAATDFSVHPVVLNKAFWDLHFTSMGAVDFLDCLKRDDSKFIQRIREYCNNLKLTEQQIAEQEASTLEALEEWDFCDLMFYRLKQQVQIYDEWESKETKTYCFSGKQYLTKGKRYAILSLDDDRSELTGFRFCHTTDIPDDKQYTSNYACHSMWRDGKEYWNWHQAYLDLWLEQNPNHPDTQKMIDYTKEKLNESQ